MKKLLCSVFALCMAFSVFSFSNPNDVKEVESENTTEPEKVNIGVLSGPSGLTMAYLIENGKAEASYEVFAAANLLLPKLVKGEIDIGFLPPNAAAKVYNANNAAVKVAAVAGQGMLNLITKDKSIKSFDDLKGKTITVAGQGATPDYMLRYLLKENGISTEGGENGVTLDFSIPNAEIAPALLAGKIDYAVVPEPFATVACSKNPDVIRAINIQKEYAKVQKKDENANFPMTVVVVNAKFADSHPELVKAFLASYKLSSEWTVANPVEAGQLVEKNNIGLNAAVASKAIPNGAYVFMSAIDGRESLESLFSIFLSFDAASIGGKLPDDGFYFK